MVEDDPKEIAALLPLLELPVELRAKIFEKLDSKSLLQLRLSCGDLKVLIDDYVGVDASLSEVCMTEANLERRFEFFSKVALRNINIGVMNGTPQTSPIRKRLKWSWWLKHHTFQDLFRYPEYVQGVTCNCEINIWLLQEIMRKCFNIKYLEFNPVSKIHGILSFVHPTDSKDLESVKEKKTVEILRYKKLHTLLLSNIDINEKKQACMNSMTILKSIRSSVLRHFKFECWPAESMEVFNELLIILKEFMIFHDKLKEVHLIFRLTTLMQDIVYLEGYNDKLKSHLKEIADRSQVEVFGLDVYSKSVWVWQPLLKHQRHLKTAQFTTLLSATIWSFDEVFLESRATLTTLNLQIYVPLQSGSFTPINLSGLENCINLKEVTISNKATNIRCVHNFHPFLSHLDCLPERLETLVISYVIMETDEIIKAMKKLNNIKNLILINSVLTRFSVFGVSIQCLEEILKKPSLDSVLITGLNMAYRNIANISEILTNNIQSEEEDKMIAFDLEIITEESCPFTWSKVPLDNRSLGHFFSLQRKVPYLGRCK